MPYYRVSRHAYNPDDAIFECEIGRIKLNIINDTLEGKVPSEDPDVSSCIEIMLEKVRRRDFPSLPCRYVDSMMVFDDLENARAFKKARRPDGIIYGVKLEDENNLFVADMNMYEQEFKTVHELEQLAKRYWKGEMTNDPIREIIVKKDNKVSIL